MSPSTGQTFIFIRALELYPIIFIKETRVINITVLTEQLSLMDAQQHCGVSNLLLLVKISEAIGSYLLFNRSQ